MKVFFLQSSSHLQLRPLFPTIRWAIIFFSRNSKPTRVTASIHPRYSILLWETVDTVISAYPTLFHTPIHLVSFSLSLLSSSCWLFLLSVSLPSSSSLSFLTSSPSFPHPPLLLYYSNMGCWIEQKTLSPFSSSLLQPFCVPCFM